MNQYSSLKDIVLGDSTNLAMARPSVLNALNKSNRRLEKLLSDLRNEANAQSELLAIAREVMAAVELNQDVALACIFLSQIAGTYAVRHCIETAIVAALVAQRMRKSRDETLVIVAAALTMNVGMLRHQNTFNKGSSLTNEEMSIVRRHPEESVGLLRDAGVEDEEWIACVLMHHENDDGTGYPEGRTSADITQNARPGGPLLRAGLGAQLPLLGAAGQGAAQSAGRSGTRQRPAAGGPVHEPDRQVPAGRAGAAAKR
jgi:HD-GYP domain-containing protein (c-di-GMP phosphodiesterase class II)